MSSIALRVIIVLSGCYLIISAGYAGALLLHLPFTISLCSILAILIGWLFFMRKLGAQTGDDVEPQQGNPAIRIATVCISITIEGCILVKAHGAYDAWLQWNSLAKYFSSAENFWYLHQQQSIWHADYPPGLPAAIGLGWRLLGTDSEILSRSISFLFYLSIPIVLCEIAARVGHIPYLWLLVLGVFTLNYECVSQGLNQYADVPLALFMLLTFITLEEYRLSGKGLLLVPAGLLLGGCMLMKNEGIAASLCILIAYLRILFRKENLLYLLVGLLLPVSVLIAYKRYVPVPNDLFDHPDIHLLKGFLEGDRYLVILINAGKFLLLRFYIALAFVLWMLYRLTGSKTQFWKSRILLGIGLYFLSVLFVYLTSGYSTRWLVPTTLNRIFMQLLPSFVYFLMIAVDKGAPKTSEAASVPLPSLL